ncbi:MAG TPA: hypothetical protein VI727_04945, partial [Candidatus Brocadiaceae bacterium]|nr:hypothetical protein [Candidatus Brocadiaceae bacterium]
AGDALLFAAPALCRFHSSLKAVVILLTLNGAAVKALPDNSLIAAALTYCPNLTDYKHVWLFPSSTHYTRLELPP